ncbi:hypothetical protein [Saccharothrix luteola]|uniref:hypothetical protein n=1 Tax=Saccharothrix luteola TaxID=2893018 RepID=UPI001E432790|nr:hypothetical protein [Saccharothrix luteola]MCC8249483.1 hypothetical protein [Saccharothrix luteola]
MTAAQEPAEPRGRVEEPVDPVDPDEIAAEAPIDPTPQEVDEYRALIGDETPEPGVTRDHRAAPATGEPGESDERSRRRVPDIPEF